MPSNSKQVSNVERRTWDKEVYEARARARSAANSDKNKSEKLPAQPGASKSEEEAQEEFIAAEAGAAGPENSERSFLRARKRTLGLDNKVGKKEAIAPDAAITTSTKRVNDSAPEINAENAVTKTGVGWHCKVCDCFLKDSNSYLDHINGRRHQKALGFSMRVERSTIDQVRERMNAAAEEERKKNEKNDDVVEEFITSFEDVVKKKDEDEEKKREERRRRRREKVANEKKEEVHEEEEEEEEDEQADMAALMGFGSFGTGRKNR